MDEVDGRNRIRVAPMAAFSFQRAEVTIRAFLDAVTETLRAGRLGLLGNGPGRTITNLRVVRRASTRTGPCWAIAILVSLVLAPTLSGQVVNTSFTLSDGRSVLQHEVTVPVPPDSVWQAFTTNSGLRSFVAPVASINLEIGGRWEASYDPNARIGDKANIVNEILSYLPHRMLSIQVLQAPPDFPYREAVQQLWTVIQLEELEDNRTRVVGTMLGFEVGAPWRDLYAIFEEDNETVFDRLQKRFTSGPINWEALYGVED